MTPLSLTIGARFNSPIVGEQVAESAGDLVVFYG